MRNETPRQARTLSGGFGGVTITKAITISSENFEAGVLVSGTNGIVINVPNANDMVVLRGLDIEGLGTSLNGITVINGGNVHVEKCTINRFSTGINFAPAVANSQLHMADTSCGTTEAARPESASLSTPRERVRPQASSTSV